MQQHHHQQQQQQLGNFAADAGKCTKSASSNECELILLLYFILQALESLVELEAAGIDKTGYAFIIMHNIPYETDPVAASVLICFLLLPLSYLFPVAASICGCLYFNFSGAGVLG
jgi:hypothetical protein